MTDFRKIAAGRYVHATADVTYTIVRASYITGYNPNPWRVLRDGGNTLGWFATLRAAKTAVNAEEI